MKQRNFLVATFCLLIAANVFAQLRVRTQGTAMLGTLDFELNNPFPDLRDTTSIQAPQHTAWHGRAQIIVRAPRRGGISTLKVSAKGLQTATLRLNFASRK